MIDAALGDEVVGSELRLAAPVPDAVDNLEDGYSFFLEDRFSLRDVLCQVNGTDWWLYEPDNGDPFFVPIDFEDRVEICARLYCESNDPESIPMSDDGGQWYSEELQRVGNVYWYEDSRWGGDPSPHHRQLYRTQKSPREEALSFFQTSDHLATYGVPNDYL